ncbi:MAG: hypothetical protein NXY57DRAFT_1042032 [Lentinula lateritia]|nr:MAG: hypothetical protein NXY57DRAFT_1042032 [Lentinula lateritia]
MVTQSRTLRISGNDTLNFTPLVPSGSVVVNVAVNSTFASDATSTMANHVPSDGIMNATSLSSASVVNATAMDSANITNLAPSDVMPDDDCDDKFYGEVRAYPDYLLGILEAQAEEVRLLHREVASVRQEKAALKRQHEADTDARAVEYRCSICLELAWDPYIQHRINDFRTKARDSETVLVTACPLCRTEVYQKPQGVQLIAKEQLAERDEWIVQLQCELEAEKTGKATSKDDSNVPQSSQAVSFTEVERRKLRVNLSRFGDIIDKARTIESLTNLNEKLQHCLVDSRQNSDSLTEELKESKETHSSASLEAANQLQKQDEEIERLQRIAVQDSTAKDPKTESLLTKLRNAESGIEEKMVKFYQGQLSQFERQVKYLEGNIATNGIHSQELNPAMQALKTGNAQLEAAVATAEKKLSDQYNVQNAEILDLKQKVHDLDASIVTKDLFSQNLSSDIKALETENANLNAVVKVAQNEFEERFATKETQASALRNTIQALEEEKRKLEETAALEKVHPLKVVDKHLGLKQINQPEVEADREAFKNLRETTEVLEQTLKELQDNLASKNSLINSLNTDLQRLETEKSKIAATAAAADKGHYHCWEDS